MRARRHLAALLLAAAVAGCRGPGAGTPVVPPPDPSVESRARAALAGLYPRGCRLMHRAVLTVAGRPYPCDGYLEISAAGELRLAVLTPMGVLTQVQVASNGTVRILSTASAFRESWSRDRLARDIRLLFAPDPSALQAGRLPDGRPVLGARRPDGSHVRYIFSRDGATWQELDIVRGSRRVYRAVCGSPARFDGHAREVPTEIRVEADGYLLDLRLCELKVRTTP